MGYSNDYRPDLTARGLGAGGKRLVGDVKFKDPLSSNPEDIKRRGCFVGFGCTEPGTRAAMYGLEQRGEKGDGDFRPGDGGGYQMVFPCVGVCGYPVRTECYGVTYSRGWFRPSDIWAYNTWL